MSQKSRVEWQCKMYDQGGGLVFTRVIIAVVAVGGRGGGVVVVVLVVVVIQLPFFVFVVTACVAVNFDVITGVFLPIFSCPRPGARDGGH